jgi:hypothetical protein
MLEYLPQPGSYESLVRAVQQQLLATPTWQQQAAYIAAPGGVIPSNVILPCFAISTPGYMLPQPADIDYDLDIWIYDSIPSDAPAEDTFLGRPGQFPGLLSLVEEAIIALAPLPSIPTDWAHVTDINIRDENIRFDTGVTFDDQTTALIAVAHIPLTYTLFTG